jgi:2-polyprenyl-3-methyl-5-hydroxy-6-metoxy-1,4-benzoquinol methylase
VRDTTAFDEKEFDLAYPPGIEHHYWTVARAAIINRALRQESLNDLKWLEVGCGRGITLRSLLNAGVDAMGVELAAVAPLEAIASYVISGRDARDLPEQFREMFMGLMLLDVIEHVADPVDFLEGLLERFPNARWVLITVPAHQELWSNYDEFYGHFRRYDRTTLHQTVAATGLRPVRLDHFFHSLYPAAQVLLRSARKRKVEVNAPSPFMRPIHALLGTVFAIEAALLPSHWPGTSLLCVATRD